jgi:hypothetical protein
MLGNGPVQFGKGATEKGWKVPRRCPTSFGKRRLETCRKVTRWPPTSLTEAEFVLFLLSCTQNRFFSSVRKPFCLEMVQIALLPLAREGKVSKVCSPAYRATSFKSYA